MSTTDMGALRYVRQHLQLYQQQAAAEQWNGEHETAMQCRDLEELIGIGLSLFNSLKERAHAVQDGIVRGAIQYSPEISEAFVEGYQDWLQPCAAVESAIQRFESRNYQVDKAEEFRLAVREISLHEFDIGSVSKAEREIREGRGKPLAEAIGELQSHCQP